ncbi:MAG TPA: IS1182 family transposase [Stellaceae bacterium]|nr:IS1182 family transposase [Stellaceae bacterium]
MRADRAQTRFDYIDLDGLLPMDHRARIVMGFVETLELSALYDAIGSREGEAGRPPADPAVLLALWLYATVEGVGSARQLTRLCEQDIAYRWTAGGVPLNYHGLADFRVAHTEVLDRLLTESVTALIAEGVVSLSEIAVDGTKVRANAGRSSFKVADKLARIEAAVEQRLCSLKAEIESDPEASSRRRQAAKERAAREVKERAERARAALERMRKEREKRTKKHPSEKEKKTEAKASLSDPDARIMRFPDLAIRPGYNAQIAVAPEQGIVVSIEMTDRRNDSGLAVPMVDNIAHRYGLAPQVLLVDTHYATAEDIAALAVHKAGPVNVYAPVPEEKDNISARAMANRKSQRAREPDSVKEWRARMETDAAQDVYRRRKFIERINANLKNHGFGILPVRGLPKVKAIALLHALANNLMAAHRLRTQPA